ncbi:O-antigen ligase family protein [Planococcus shixiaomingii]|uniref:O-antigen ligase family protein n=1 Tax=Planococcus shixiaomingii TaxID=3058393 RepID=UPI002614483A|nr:O-antigen ligase family protein [Planococcus sp. N022]WKA53974.1 O-antigen ligase family protein [Planococcus sp. N022]
MIYVNEQKNTSIFLSCLFITSVYLNAYYIDIGFALKPYMIVCMLVFFLVFFKFRIHKLRLFEMNILVFFIFYSATGIFSKYPQDSIRLIMAINLVLVVYFIMRFIFSSISIIKLEKAISISGIWFNVLSIALFVYGTYTLSFNFVGNGVRAYGILIDRGVPRLIGTFSDPNIFAFGNFIFFYYYLTHLKEKGTKIGLLLSATTLLLTFSRGAYLAILLGGIILLITSKTKIKVKIALFGPLFLYVLVTGASNFFNLNATQIVIDRFKASSSDNGSGRLDLWNNGLTLFADNPLFGIGIYNYRSYSNAIFNTDHYMHNTFLEVLTESGIFGFCLYLTIFLLVFYDFYIHRKSIIDTRYLFITLISMLVLMNSLSLVANEVFFLIMAMIWRYLFEIDKNQKKI